MKPCCPQCRVGLVRHLYIQERGWMAAGEFECPSCGRATPVMQGFPLFTETGPTLAGPEKVAALDKALFKSRAEIAEFVYRQSKRPIFDAYAAYYPFNEALVGVLRFQDLVREILAPGDRILDLNCRTGWTGEFLAALFPEQQVVSLWEGNKGVLAYSGYAYWLPQSSRAGNLDIVFLQDKRHLPFPDDAFKLVFAYDFLHHHVDTGVLDELLRVNAADGALLFPHVHTNHSVPEPYFVREGRLLSAAEWCRLLSSLSRKGHRAPCVISELDIFGPEPVKIATRDHIEHYNCCVIVAPEHWQGRWISPQSPRTPTGNEYFFVNPLVEVDLNLGRVSIDPGAMDGGVRHLLDRHPAIEQDLRERIDTPLSRCQRRFLYWTAKGLNYSQVRGRLERDAGSLDAEIGDLVARRILLALPVSQAMWLLQHYYRHRLPIYPAGDHVFHTLWRSLESRYAGYPVIVNHDGSEFDVENTRLLVNAFRSLLSERGIGRGDHLLIVSGGHLEVLIACWAAWLNGVVVAVVDPGTAQTQIRSLVRELAVLLVLSEPGDTDAVDPESEVITFDDMSSDASPENSFSSRINPFLGRPIDDDATLVTENCAALILCTSGSSGSPKKVSLSHGSLFRSGDILARCYGWDRGERLLSLGPMYSMSGLRNPATAALHAGTTIVVASHNQRTIAPVALRAIDERSVNIVTAVPAFLENLDRLVEQGRALALPGLRLLLTTASRVDADVQRRLSAYLDVEIADYYGLTETGGICIAQLPDREYADGSIGTAVGCLCEIRAPDNTPLGEGEPGHLHIYSDNLMKGYVGGPESGSTVSDGWLATGDEARFLEGGDIQLLGRLDGARKNRRGEFISRASIGTTD